MADDQSRNIVVMGLRGAGKTTLGRALAARLSRVFVDLDAVTLELMACVSVARAWRAHGEPAFRDAERRALEMTLGRRGLVVSLGGGTPTAPGCGAMLREAESRGEVLMVYLHGEPEMLARRVADGPPEHRPRLLGLGEHQAVEEMERVYAARDPLYRALASLVVDASGDADEVLDAVVKALEEASRD